MVWDQHWDVDFVLGFEIELFYCSYHWFDFFFQILFWMWTTELNYGNEPLLRVLADLLHYSGWARPALTCWHKAASRQLQNKENRFCTSVHSEHVRAPREPGRDWEQPSDAIYRAAQIIIFGVVQETSDRVGKLRNSILKMNTVNILWSKLIWNIFQKLSVWCPNV